MRPLALLLLVIAGCAEPAPGTPAPSDPAPEPTPLPDTLRLDAAAPELRERPRAPLRVDGACPFEGCQYAAWTTSAETTVYAAPDTAATTFAVPAGTRLDADRGFVLLTRIGQAVTRRAAEVYVSSEDTRAVAAGDTLWVLDHEGEGSFRVWTGGTLAYSADLALSGLGPDESPFQLFTEPEAQWWAHVTAPDGRTGWLWMERTPPVRGGDRFG